MIRNNIKQKFNRWTIKILAAKQHTSGDSGLGVHKPEATEKIKKEFSKEVFCVVLSDKKLMSSRRA